MNGRLGVLMDDEQVTRTELAAPELEEEAVRFFESLQSAAAAGLKAAEVDYGGVALTVGLPPLGEGDRGMVYPLKAFGAELPGATGPLCVKVAKQQPICRERLLEESMTTEFFLAEGVAVPRIYHMDPLGRFCVKDFVEGESITSLYLRFTSLTIPTQRLILETLEKFLTRLLELFRKRPDCKVSISPNNIYVLTEEGRFTDPPSFVLIDPGTTLKKNYDSYTFANVLERGPARPDPEVPAHRLPAVAGAAGGDVVRARRGEGLRDLPRPDAVGGVPPAQGGEDRGVRRRGGDPPGRERRRQLLPGPRGRGRSSRKGAFDRPGEWGLRVGRGSVLGEMAFLLHVPRSMTVVAATRVQAHRDRLATRSTSCSTRTSPRPTS